MVRFTFFGDPIDRQFDLFLLFGELQIQFAQTILVLHIFDQIGFLARQTLDALIDLSNLILKRAKAKLVMRVFPSLTSVSSIRVSPTSRLR